MLVKKYEAETIDKALQIVKKELGPEALILSTQQKKRKWYQKGSIEIMAAMEKEKEEESNGFDEGELEKVFPNRYARGRVPSMEGKPATESIRKTHLNRYLDFSDSPTRDKQAAPPTPKKVLRSSVTERVRESSGSRDGSGHSYIKGLMQVGLSENGAKEIARQLIFDYSIDERKRPSKLKQIQTRLLAAQLETVPLSWFDSYRKWAAIGVGGVGKTSFLVKLAIFLKSLNHDVSLVGCDQRKIVGRKELASYAKLIGANFASQIAEDSDHKKCQLIDTPAFSLSASEDSRYDLEKICQGTQPFVLLDASCRLKEMLKIVEQARCLSPIAVAFTRLDIASQYGVLYDLLKETKLPLLGLSLSASFRQPFKLFEPEELATFILRKGGSSA